jgi:hypothetical protein
MTPRKSVATARRYNRVQIRQALTHLAFRNGNLKGTIRELHELGWEGPDIQTLRSWRNKHADIYEECLTQADNMTIPEIDRVMRGHLYVQALANERIIAGFDNDEIDAVQASTINRNAAVGFGITTEKSQLLKGQPTERVEHDLYADLRVLEQIAARAPRVEAVDSTAVEITSPSKEESSDG